MSLGFFTHAARGRSRRRAVVDETETAPKNSGPCYVRGCCGQDAFDINCRFLRAAAFL
jgi:hypothetical protein